MKWNIFPRIYNPNWDYWKQCFPYGIGPSIFSSPGWQRLMHEEMGPPWRLALLQGETSRSMLLSLPVLVKTNLWGRSEITTRPIAYYVLPIEGYSICCEEAIPALLSAAGTFFTAGFSLWQPPWCTWQKRDVHNHNCAACSRSVNSPWCCVRPKIFTQNPLLGTIKCSLIDTYLIDLDVDCEQYFATRVKRTQRQHVSATQNAGIEILSNPSFEYVKEYYNLYLKIHRQRNWEGKPFSENFFHGVCTSLEQGGELIVMRHEGRVVAGGIILYDKYAVHLFQTTTDRDVKGIYPHTVLYKIAIERAAQKNLRYINFGCVNEGNEGLKRFKEEWGAKATPVPTITWRSDPRAMAQKSFTTLDEIIREKIFRRRHLVKE